MVTSTSSNAGRFRSRSHSICRKASRAERDHKRSQFRSGTRCPGRNHHYVRNESGPGRRLTSAVYDSSSVRSNPPSRMYSCLFDNIPAPLIYVPAGPGSGDRPVRSFWPYLRRVCNWSMEAYRSNILDVQRAMPLRASSFWILSGQGAIINQDGSINARLNGSGTRQHHLDLCHRSRRRWTGRFRRSACHRCALPQAVLPVGVRIGGRVADVTYSGAAPGASRGHAAGERAHPGGYAARNDGPGANHRAALVTSQPNVMLATRP